MDKQEFQKVSYKCS